MIGIYKITSPNNRIYIGQAINIHRRFNSYKRLNSCKTQPKLYRSFLKYGVENHKFEIIEECLELELNEKERYWQDFYDVLNGGLNCILQNSKDKPKVITDEVRYKYGCKRRKVINTNDNKIFDSAKAAAKYYNIVYVSLIHMLNGYCKNKTSLKYLDGIENNDVLNKKQYRKSLNLKGGAKRKYNIPILYYDLNMNFIKEFNSAYEIAELYNIRVEVISANLNNKTKKSLIGYFKYKH